MEKKEFILEERGVMNSNQKIDLVKQTQKKGGIFGCVSTLTGYGFCDSLSNL